MVNKQYLPFSLYPASQAPQLRDERKETCKARCRKDRRGPRRGGVSKKSEAGEGTTLEPYIVLSLSKSDKQQKKESGASLLPQYKRKSLLHARC